MRCLAVVLLCCVLVLVSADLLPNGVGQGGGHGVGHGIGHGGGCMIWCRTPLGVPFCCKRPGQANPLPRVKAGICPPVPPVCPPTRSQGSSQPCTHDEKCRGSEKCCYDTCSQEHVCKLPNSSGRRQGVPQ
ncbi:uncharacterized protein LOC143031263 [Oratosquilla oratoria]|uniref:uncharacterized protein LOC143031263 n=1 Tax=Oratosquilla oratoria TaxID=337810 RepID=UPI003F76FBD2